MAEKVPSLNCCDRLENRAKTHDLEAPHSSRHSCQTTPGVQGRGVKDRQARLLQRTSRLCPEPPERPQRGRGRRKHRGALSTPTAGSQPPTSGLHWLSRPEGSSELCPPLAASQSQTKSLALGHRGARFF